MRTLPLWQVDAFTDRVFGGNPAAVVAIDDGWLHDDILQAIAGENNLAETAFVLKGRAPVPLRWFTPRVEVPLCGHATLAAALVLGEELKQFAPDQPIDFETKSGSLTVRRVDGRYVLDFPARPTSPSELPKATLADAIGTEVLELFESVDRYVCVVKDEGAVASLTPNIARICALPLPGVVVTALSDGGAFVSRYFAPAKGVDEDPVTGTSHCTLAPFWGARLGKDRMLGRQLSARSGAIQCRVASGRVLLEGCGRIYLRGEIYVPI